jgi:hypothetical protein
MRLDALLPVLCCCADPAAFGRRQGLKDPLVDQHDQVRDAKPGKEKNCQDCNSFGGAGASLQTHPYIFSARQGINVSIPNPIFNQNWELTDNVPRECCGSQSTVMREGRVALLTIVDTAQSESRGGTGRSALAPLLVMLESFHEHNEWFASKGDIIIPYSQTSDSEAPSVLPIANLPKRDRDLIARTFVGRLIVLFHEVRDDTYFSTLVPSQHKNESGMDSLGMLGPFGKSHLLLLEAFELDQYEQVVYIDAETLVMASLQASLFDVGSDQPFVATSDDWEEPLDTW